MKSIFDDKTLEKLLLSIDDMVKINYFIKTEIGMHWVKSEFDPDILHHVLLKSVLSIIDNQIKEIP